MEKLLDKLEQVVIHELKTRSGLRASWELMATSQRVDFIKILRGHMRTVIELAPTAGKNQQEKKNQAGGTPTGQKASSSTLGGNATSMTPSKTTAK